MLNQFVSSVVDAGREWLQGEKKTGDHQNKDIKTLCHDLLQAKGEATSAALAYEVVITYQNLNKDERESFFNNLVNGFDLDTNALIKYAQTYKTARNQETFRKLMSKTESLRQELFRRINQAQRGTALLVDLRAEVLSGLSTHPHWGLIALDLEHLLSSWFNRGFLRVERIDWRSPAIILEKLISYESVHKIEGWDDLHRRLAHDRRCYAFFHPVLPDEPLIFVEVALVKGLANSIDKILDIDATVMPVDTADTAIFYSINNCQKGLRGISFGDFLIKQVVTEIKKEVPNIRTFSTLSPVPGFRKWLKRKVSNQNAVILNSDSKQLIVSS